MVWLANTNQGVGKIKAVNTIKVENAIIVEEAKENLFIDKVVTSDNILILKYCESLNHINFINCK
jgi:hypothetical protein